MKPNAGGDETPANGPNPRPANKYGQIVRWVPEGGDHVSNRFTWDLFLLAGNPGVHNDDTWSADERTMFIGIQHPGADGNSHWPDGGTSVPKSAIIAIEREDGGIIG